MEVIEQIDIANEAHVAKVNIVENSLSYTVIIVNLHAPCPHDQQKVDFFNKIKEAINRLQGNESCKLIILGDYNLAFAEHERINTKFTNK